LPSGSPDAAACRLSRASCRFVTLG
jgi:hypothetical protein